MHVEISAVHSRLLYSRCLNSTRRTSVQLSRTRFPAFRNQFYCTAGHEDYPPNLSKLIQSFSIVPDPMLRYKQLLFLAKKLPSFPEEQRVDDNKVHGCTSQVQYA
uniref:Fe-S metabolism associated domain-containing protein n=1 Tax=Ostreococcus mediterraneus TaxID=1486918 RepID=A0A6T5Z365_9CHLO|mmetsp:Transcript_4151/g.8978  ORF Transcript_4151/g.8978 Transcript_4151/m.8978 type:complete len:105 (+) Transcript_4151:111-425(+)